MTDPTGVIVVPPPRHDADFSSGLAIPPLDDAFFSQQFMESNGSGDNQDDDVFHEDVDFDFSFDDLCLPSSDLDELLSDPIYNTTPLENGNLLDEVNAGPGLNLDQYHGVFKSDCPNLRHLPAGSDKSSNGSGVLDSNSPGLESDQISGYLNVPSPESNGSNPGNSGSSGAEAKGTYCPSPESQGSGNCCSDVSKNSENCARAVNSMPNANISLISSDNVDQKIKFSGSPNVHSAMLKRKKESNDLEVCDVDNNLGSRINKFRESECNVGTNHNSYSISCSNEDDDKKKARLMRNRESAQLSRQRKKQYVDELEDKVRAMHSTIQDLNAKISFFMTENMTLRQQMGTGGSNGALPPPQMVTPHPGMFPHPATMYPWMPSVPPYMMRPHGSQVPLVVPIPRLKSQQPANVAKDRKKVEAKKSGGAKSKKVAAVSFLGLLFFIILFGNLVPMISMKYGGVKVALSSDNSYIRGGYYENHHGRLFMANGTEHVEKYGGGRESSCNSGGGGARCSQRGHGSGGEPGTDGIVHLGNGSKPLVASLYVPRNDKLVKIDGNLIIHSVLASEKAMILQGQEGGENGLAVRGDLAPAVPVPGMGRNGARLPHLRALGSGSADKDSLKSKANDGRLQQWFREGLSGPMLSSGMCTEVFQFDVSSASTSGAIVPATASRNISERQNKNSTHLSKRRNRRILRGHPIPFPGSSHNISKEQAGRHSQNKNLNLNKSASSVVVSVLVDPREASDTDVDGVMGAKALSRIFVVVLIDSVKYVTYSCMLPFKGAAPHLVTT